MLPRRMLQHVRRHDWFAVGVDLVIVILGIFIGLQATLWVEGARDRAAERRYLERLREDSVANETALERAIAVYDRRGATLAAVAAALERQGAMPESAELSDVMCRWFIQPAVGVRRGTYLELISTGRLALLRDESLRMLLTTEEAAHAEAARLDILAPVMFQVAAPLNDHRDWRIGDARAGEVDCSFDAAGMRADPRMGSVVAQLYRDQATHRFFREQELTAVRGTRERLDHLLGG